MKKHLKNFDLYILVNLFFKIQKIKKKGFRKINNQKIIVHIFYENFLSVLEYFCEKVLVMV